jgi:hypothetical protein
MLLMFSASTWQAFSTLVAWSREIRIFSSSLSTRPDLALLTVGVKVLVWGGETFGEADAPCEVDAVNSGGSEPADAWCFLLKEYRGREEPGSAGGFFDG